MGNPLGVSPFEDQDKDETDHPGVPVRHALKQNIPNPFNPSTVIYYDVAEPGAVVKVEIFNVMGQRIRSLVDQYKEPGQHEIAWDGMDANGQRVSSSVFFARMTAGDVVETRKLTLLK
jgi:hypothetical protein